MRECRKNNLSGVIKMQKERRKEISCLNTLFCIFVIFIHIISYAVGGFDFGTLKYNAVMFPWRMVSVVVPGFIMLSGIKVFLTGKDEMPYFKYILSRIKGIILPYTVCFVCYYLFYMVAYGYKPDIKFIFDVYIHGSLACHFYFIPLLFQFDILMPLWKRLINRVNPVIVIPFAFLLTSLFAVYYPGMVSIISPENPFVYNDRFFMTYLCYWITGCYIGKYYEEFCKMLKDNFKAICIIFGIVFAMFFNYTYLAFNYITYIPFMNYVHDLYTISVILFLYAILLKFPPKLPKFISAIDRASFDIYLWHMIFVLIADHIISDLAITAQLPAFGIRFVFAYGITIPCCILFGHIKKRLKAFREVKKND